MFATGPRQAAYESKDASHSPFTEALLKFLRPGSPLSKVLQDVRKSVALDYQVPGHYVSCDEDVVLFPTVDSTLPVEVIGLLDTLERAWSIKVTWLWSS